MSTWKNTHKTFIERTIKISEICFEKCRDEDCEISLLLNCCLGLLIVPKEKEIESISFGTKNPLKGLFTITKDENSKNQIISDKNLLIFLRNSIAHFGVSVSSQNEDMQITKIEFENKYGKIHQKAEISVEKFEKFFKEFSSLLK